MTKTIAAIVGMVVMTSCAPKEANYSEADELAYARVLMKNLAAEIAEIPATERSSIRCMEQLYAHLHPKEGDFDSFDKERSYHFKDLPAGKDLMYDLLVFPNQHGKPDKDAVFIAAPRPISLGGDREVRIVLLHDLQVVEFDEKNYHWLVARQFRMPVDE